ncbi:MAG: hypothetical protein IKA04_09280 [Alistipes sp.]|nr:hypothetical protein [Alistipes sp.]
MARIILLVAMLLASVATRAAVGETDSLSSANARREARKVAYAAEIDDIVKSRNYIFRPITMQNVVAGNTRSIYAYYLFMGVSGDKVVLHLPVEFTSYVIDTVNLDSFVEGYTATLDGSNWRITFSFMNGTERWLAEIFLSNITGQTRLALVTPKGVMRYLGTLESGATIKKKRKNR